MHAGQRTSHARHPPMVRKLRWRSPEPHQSRDPLVCVPVIMWAVIAALWTVPPILPQWFKPGLWAVVAMFAAFLFYHRLSRNLGYAMAIVFIVSGAIAWALYGALGPRALLVLAAALFVAAWIGQFVGHAIEGRRPAF